MKPSGFSVSVTVTDKREAAELIQFLQERYVIEEPSSVKVEDDDLLEELVNVAHSLVTSDEFQSKLKHGRGTQREIALERAVRTFIKGVPK